MENREKLIQEAQSDGIVIFDSGYQRFHCEICNKPMSGIISVGDHLVNSKHTETAARIAISNIRNAPRSLLRVLSPEVKEAAEEDIIEVVVPPGGIPGINCKVCAKPLTGLAPLQQHLLGSDHRKKLNRSQLLTSPQSPSGGHDTWNQLTSGTSPNTSYQAPADGIQMASIGHQAPYNATSNIQNPYTRNQVPSAMNQTPIEATSYTLNKLSEATVSPSSIQKPCGTASNTWCQDPNNRIPDIPDDRHHVPTEKVICRTLWTGNSAIPSRNVMEISEPYTTLSPSSFDNTGAFPRAKHTQVLPDTSTCLMQQEVENRLVNPAPAPPLEDQIVRYNKTTMRYECLICHMPILGDSRGISAHLTNKNHREEGAKYAIENPHHVPEYLMDFLPPGAIEAAIAGILYLNQSRAFQCRSCDKIFTGVHPLREHLVSFDHRKKTGNMHQDQPSVAQHLQTPHDGPIDELTLAFEKGIVICTDNSNDEVVCKVCNITLNGQKNLADHLNGKKHQKRQMQQEMQNPITPPLRNGADHQNNLRPTSKSSGIEPVPGRGPTNPTENITEIHPSLMPYDVSSTPRGQVHIFNYLFLGRKEDPKERKGAQHDSVSLMNTFSKMGYQVFCHKELTRNETILKLDEIRSDRILFQVDALIMFFLSHGNQPFTFYTFDRQELDLHEIWSKFTDSGCPAMKKKPKIFFANFCRGMDNEMLETDATIDIPRDMVTIHASSEGITALRSPKRGTHFVRALCQILESDDRNLELRDIYHKLDVEVKKLGGRQPKWEDDRFRKFYFNPQY